MEYFHNWLILSGAGILFGFFPGFATVGANLIEAVLVQKKKVARWMYKVFNIDQTHQEIILSNYGPRSNKKLCYYFSLAYVIIILVGGHLLSLDELAKGNIVEILSIETSFPFFLLLTWLLPVYLINRYLRKLKPAFEAEPDHYTYYD